MPDDHHLDTMATVATRLEVVAIEVAQEAAAMVRDAAKRVRTLRTKSTPTDVVTQLDVEAETLIRDLLTDRVPGSALAGEELEDHAGTSSIGWVIDPIDGSVNLLYGVPIVAVSIGATFEGTIVAGAVCDVFRGETYSGAAGKGARLDGEKIGTGSDRELSQSLLATGYSYDAALRERQGEEVHGLLPLVRDIRSFGSAALHLSWVACGRIDGYFERNLAHWDYAAGGLVAREAGAFVELPNDANGGLTLASAPGIFQELKQILSARPLVS